MFEPQLSDTFTSFGTGLMTNVGHLFTELFPLFALGAGVFLGLFLMKKIIELVADAVFGTATRIDRALFIEEESQYPYEARNHRISRVDPDEGEW